MTELVKETHFYLSLRINTYGLLAGLKPIQAAPLPMYPLREALIEPRGGRAVMLSPGVLVLFWLTLICLPLKSESSSAIAVWTESFSANSM